MVSLAIQVVAAVVLALAAIGALAFFGGALEPIFDALHRRRLARERRALYGRIGVDPPKDD